MGLEWILKVEEQKLSFASQSSNVIFKYLKELISKSLGHSLGCRRFERRSSYFINSKFPRRSVAKTVASRSNEEDAK